MDGRQSLRKPAPDSCQCDRRLRPVIIFSYGFCDGAGPEQASYGAILIDPGTETHEVGSDQIIGQTEELLAVVAARIKWHDVITANRGRMSLLFVDNDGHASVSSRDTGGSGHLHVTRSAVLSRGWTGSHQSDPVGCSSNQTHAARTHQDRGASK